MCKRGSPPAMSRGENTVSANTVRAGTNRMKSSCADLGRRKVLSTTRNPASPESLPIPLRDDTSSVLSGVKKQSRIRSINSGDQPRRARGIGAVFRKRAGEHLFLVTHTHELEDELAREHDKRPGLQMLQRDPEERDLLAEIERMADARLISRCYVHRYRPDAPAIKCEQRQRRRHVIEFALFEFLHALRPDACSRNFRGLRSRDEPSVSLMPQAMVRAVSSCSTRPAARWRPITERRNRFFERQIPQCVRVWPRGL